MTFKGPFLRGLLEDMLQDKGVNRGSAQGDRASPEGQGQKSWGSRKWRHRQQLRDKIRGRPRPGKPTLARLERRRCLLGKLSKGDVMQLLNQGENLRQNTIVVLYVALQRQRLYSQIIQ